MFIALLCISVAIKGPEFHYDYVRNKVQKTTVLVTNETKTRGGSGAHVIAPSGKVYIITNAHVCNLSKDANIFITDNFGRTIPRRILEISNFTDLCLVESLPNYQGALKLGSDVRSGQIIAAVGHPILMPTTMSRGEIIGVKEVDVFDHIMDVFDKNDKCDLPKNRIIQIDTFFGPITACFVHVKANLTTSVVLPGSSGSPMVDFYGNLVGVIFAGNQANWGLAITLADINLFLKPY